MDRLDGILLMTKDLNRTFAMAVVLLSLGIAYAGPMYGIRGNFGEGEASDLIEIDPLTGAMVQSIGDTGLDGVSGFAIHPATGVFYAAVSVSSTSAPGLYTIDPATGAATLVAPSADLQVTDMAFDSSGTLYASRGILYQDIITVDLVTGLPTVVGIPGVLAGSVGIAFDSSDTLYLKTIDDIPDGDEGDGFILIDVLYTLDPTDASVLTSLTLTGSDEMLRNSLAIDDSDVLYSTMWGSYPDESEYCQIHTIDPVTGVVTPLPQVISPYLDATLISAVDFAPDATVPEPASLSLLVLGSLGLLRRRSGR